MNRNVIVGVVAGLAATFLIATLVSRRPKALDPITAATGLQGRDLLALRGQLLDVRATDEEAAKRMEISAQEAKERPTAELVRDFLKGNEWAKIFQYDNPDIGIYRLSLVSPALSEMARRKDFPESMIKAYAAFDVDPRTNPTFEQEGGPMAPDVMQRLIGYRGFFGRFKGHEKPLIAALCRKYREMMRVNATYPEKKRPYVQDSFPLELAFALQRQLGLDLPSGVSIEAESGHVHFAPTYKPNVSELVAHFEAISV